MASIDGLDKLLATLSGLGGDVKQSCLKGGRRGMKKVQKNAKMLCPVDTGELRGSIKENGEIKGDEINCKVYTNCEHAAYPEFGTGERGRESNIERPLGVSYKADWKGQAAQPYLTPAYLHAKNTGEVEQEVIKSIQSDIRKLGVKK